MKRFALTLSFSFLFIMLVSSGSIHAQNGDNSRADSLQPSHKDLPLKPDRTIHIQTNEATWLSVAISPDGSKLAFEFMGDLYEMPVSGGEPRRLTRGLAFDTEPSYSPDGKKLVFISDRSGGDNVWVLDLETLEATQRTRGNNYRMQSPIYSPDGQYIIAARAGLRGGVHKLWMYHVDGGSGTEFMETSGNQKTIEPVFSHDGNYIWFSQRSGDWNYNATGAQYQIAKFDLATGESHTQTARLGSAFTPTLSPDGKWLVYGTRHNTETALRLRNLQTGDDRWLAYPVQRDDMESRGTRGVLPRMAFTPDSRNVIATYDGRLWKVPVEEGAQAVEIPFSFDVEVDIAPQLEFKYPIEDSETFVARQIRDGVPSPDGKRFAFTVLDRLYVMDLPDGTPRRLTNHDFTEAFPTWSPDGNWVAFATWDPTVGGHIYKVRADGRRSAQRLTNTPAIYQDLAWSKTQERIVAVRGEQRKFYQAPGPFVPFSANEFIWVSSNGGDANFIAGTNGRRTPHFILNDDRIYLNHTVRGLISIRYDGTDERQHLQVTGPSTPGAGPNRASTILMAPQGNQALAQVGSDLYAVTVPRTGTAPTINVSNPANAAFPSAKLTEIGAQFPAWGWDGRNIHWSLGNALLTYNLDDAEARKREQEKFDEEQKAARDEKDDDNGDDNGDDENGNGEEDEEAEPEDDPKKPEDYKPVELRIKIDAPRDIPSGTIVLRGGTAITMNGYEIIENADIVIQNNRIIGIGQRGSVDVPQGAEIRDVSGRTIVPGFVDTHAHVRPYRNLHQPQIWSFMANLAYGVTTLRDPQTGTTDLLTYADMVTSGKVLGPRIYQTGPGVFWAEQISNLDHAKRVLKRYSEYFDTKTIKMYVAGNRQQRQWIMQAAKEQQLMPTTEGSLDMKLNMTMLLDGYPGQEHNYPITPVYNDVIKFTAESKMAYTPTLLVTYGGPWAENYFFERENAANNAKLLYFTPRQDVDGKARRRGAGWFHEEEYVMDRQSRTVQDIYNAGGILGVGSHGQLQGLGFHWELWAMAYDDMNPHHALRTATIHGAIALGLDGDIGTLEPGKMADLLILHQNPLDDIRNTDTIEYVMINGRLFNGDNLHEVWPRVQGTGPIWFQEQEPVNLPGLNNNR